MVVPILAQDLRPPAEYLTAGTRALQWVRAFVALGPRPAGSDAIREQAAMMEAELRKLRCRVSVDAFVAPTPRGAIPMRNIIATFGDPSASGVTVISGHYDTKALPGFVGANDGGSSAALLMVLADRLDNWPPGTRPPVWIVFFDGEESVVEWRDGDHTYGSRRLARAWGRDGTARRVRALVNVDMVGDAGLGLLWEGYSDSRVRGEIWDIARRLGYADAFGDRVGYVEDDHVPFLRIGVPAVNLIDFDYGPGNSHWHTAQDSVDKLSPVSFAVMLHVLETMLLEMAPA